MPSNTIVIATAVMPCEMQQTGRKHGLNDFASDAAFVTAVPDLQMTNGATAVSLFLIQRLG
jgi:hypothetical protein